VAKEMKRWWQYVVACVGMVVLAGTLHEASAQVARPPARTGGVKAPEWYEKLPGDPANFQARGSGKSKDMQVAIDKAVVEARASIVREIDARWKALLAAIRNETHVGDPGKAGTVTLSGTSVVRQTAVKRGRAWTGFAVVSLSEEGIHNELIRRLHQNAEWYERVKGSRGVLDFEGGQAKP
jgi:hypothetical protein